MWLNFLDSKPLALLANHRATPEADRCRRWSEAMLTAGARIFVPEIVDYEVRRELHRLGSEKSIARLDQLKEGLDYAPLNTGVLLRAAELWAEVRRRGLPTAAADALDVDVILAAQALGSAGPDDLVTVVTGNARHLGRFVDARSWAEISPG